MLKGSTRMAVIRVKDRMRDGASLMQMHTPHGKKWFVVPGREVDEGVAKRVVAEADVFPSQDGLFPGISQTYKIGQRAPTKNPRASVDKPVAQRLNRTERN